MKQADLFKRGNPRPPYVKGSETSRAAAESVRMVADSLRSKVYDAIAYQQDRGLTDFQLFNHFPFHTENSIRPRRIELVRAGLVKDSGRKRKTSSGRDAVVWIINDERNLPK